MATLVFRNRGALFLWGFAAAWVGMLALITALVFRGGGPADRSPAFHLAVFGLFWLAALGLAAFAARQSCTTVRVFDDGSMDVVQRFPFRRIAQRFGPSSRPRAYLTRTTDNEGDPSFVCELGIGAPFRPPLRVAEGRRERCEDALRRINDARR